MSANKIIFDAVRPWLDAQGFTVDRVRALDDACARFAQAAGLAPPALAAGPDAVALVQEFEGYATKLADGRCQAYPDPGSGGEPWTIGWGSTTDELGQPLTPHTVWTRERAAARRADQLRDFSAEVVAALGGAPTTQPQFDAMVSLAYNIGMRNFSGSTLLRKHKAGDFAGAQAQFAVWNRASGKVMNGLTRRRAAEAALYGRKP